MNLPEIEPRTLMRYLPGYHSGIFIPCEVIANSIVLTHKVNKFLEKEVLVPHDKIGFAEYPNFMGRGKTSYNPRKPETMQKMEPAGAFERELWPSVGRNSKNNRTPNRLYWWISYGIVPDFDNPDFDNTSSVFFGYMYDHDLPNTAPPEEIAERMGIIEENPYFIGASYKSALKEGKTFSDIKAFMSCLKPYILELPYRKSL